jgi:hypothetical protein
MSREKIKMYVLEKIQVQETGRTGIIPTSLIRWSTCLASSDGDSCQLDDK